MMLLLVGCTSKSGENSGTDDKNTTEGQVESVQTSDTTEIKSVSEDRGSEQNETQNSRVAVVYFSGTGKTKAVAYTDLF